MPRPVPPPTPGSSTDIKGKEARHTAPVLSLPPTAYQGTDAVRSNSSTPSANGSDSSYRPVSPTSPAPFKQEQESSHTDRAGGGRGGVGGVVTKNDFSLPPPPTRSRKITQWKPTQSEQTSADTTSAAGSAPTPTPRSGGRKKQGNGQTAAGRKIARKTAHSLIERRRRSKMNEEFGVLKDMIPACKGQEMHKLAILQAGIDYMRYLEQCISDLKLQNHNPQRPPPPPSSSAASQIAMDEDDVEEDDEEMSDVESASNNDNASTPQTAPLEKSSSLVSLPSLSHLMSTLPPATSASTTFSANASGPRSIASTSQPSYSPYIHSNHTSPAFGPQVHHVQSMQSQRDRSDTFSSLTSPALAPVDSPSNSAMHGNATSSAAADWNAESRERNQHELDQEATAALLMLNHDRRNWTSASSSSSSHHRYPYGETRTGSGMSVKDLLTG